MSAEENKAPVLRIFDLLIGGGPGADRGVGLMVGVVRQRLHSAVIRLKSARLQILQTAVAACVAGS